MYPSIEANTASELVETYAPLVKRIAYHLIARLPPSVSADDLIQAGMLGLLDACRQYDPSQGAKFETYARIRVRGAMLDELRRNDWAPKSVHRRMRDVEVAIKVIEARYGRDARDGEVAECMGIELDEYYHILQDARSCTVLTLDDAGLEDNLSRNDPGEGLRSPLDSLLTEQFHQELANAISSLPERERMVVSFYYDNELNLREIGQLLGVSESRISQLLSQAHLRLRSRLRSGTD